MVKTYQQADIFLHVLNVTFGVDRCHVLFHTMLEVFVYCPKWNARPENSCHGSEVPKSANP